MTSALSSLGMHKAFRRRQTSVSTPARDVTQQGYASFSVKEMDTGLSDLTSLNTSLEVLAALFPDVAPEVFREMLLAISPQSRLEIATEHLLKDKGKWVKGRYRLPATAGEGKDRIARDDTFRSAEYRQAVKDALHAEFKGLSKSSIRTVLGERNFSYTASRAVLLQISARSWRSYFSRLLGRRGAADAEACPLIGWTGPRGADANHQPYVITTASSELNDELYLWYVRPVLERARREREAADARLAAELNLELATKEEALFECECCYSEGPWEGMVSCHAGHIICTECVRRAMGEAVFGQGWARSVDIHKGTLRCLAPGMDGCCLPPDLVKQALLQGEEGDKVWSSFEDKLSIKAIEQCGLRLERCPFCSYAGVQDTPVARVRDLLSVADRLANNMGACDTRGTIFWILLQPLALVYILLWLVLHLLYDFAPGSFSAAHERVLQRRRGLRFTCEAPRCGITSCKACHEKWTDPHVCYETSTNSLRQAIEAATTAVVKRVCPRCNTSFVKSTGCNKLVCPCGYIMCYICRSSIGNEGYAHFCQHFRAEGGRCRECNRCDLYAVEDEAAVIQQAAQQAEQEWREKEGVSIEARKAQGTDALRHVREEMLRGVGKGRGWNMDDAMDAFLELMLA